MMERQLVIEDWVSITHPAGAHSTGGHAIGWLVQKNKIEVNAMTKKISLLLFALLFLALTACSPQAQPQASFDPAAIRFDGEQAFSIETEFVTRFPNRHSGQPNNRLATEWIYDQFTAAGWACSYDDWEAVLYSVVEPMRNVVCRLPGASAQEIMVAAHHDQASTTIQGADNDGSGIAILIQLATIFGAEDPLPYSLVFVASDGEEYGMLGTQQFISTHSDPKDILAGISLDNLGFFFYDGMNMELIGQYRQYGQLWLALTAREAARSSGDSWTVNLRAPLDQALDQAAPISFMDQGPMVAAGVPALGFLGNVPPEYADLKYKIWHDPSDTMEHQSAVTLGHSGVITEALIRQLQAMEDVPRESGPYLYFDETGQVLRGAPLWALFAGFVGLFFLGTILTGNSPLKDKVAGWKQTLPHFLSLWLPLVAGVLLLYLFVAVGLLLDFEVYVATTKDPYLLNPPWLPIGLFLAGLALFFFVGRRLFRRFGGNLSAPEGKDRKSFAFLVIGLAGLYVLTTNPFSLLFFLPLIFWFLFRGKRGAGKLWDILMLLMGGLVVYALVYFFGFLTLRYDFAFLWMFLNMFAIGMVGFATALASTAILAAGLSVVVEPA
jgi:hypothetical protein